MPGLRPAGDLQEDKPWQAPMHTFHQGRRMDGSSALSPDLKGGGDFSQPGSSAQTARAWAPLR